MWKLKEFWKSYLKYLCSNFYPSGVTTIPVPLLHIKSEPGETYHPRVTNNNEMFEICSNFGI